MNEHDGEVLLPGLRGDLVAGARRQRGRRRRRSMLGGSMVVAASVVVTALMLGRADPAAADLDIRERGGRLEILLADAESRPGAVEEALRDAGIDASVDAVPVGPSNVGRFVGFTTDLPADIQPLDSNGIAFPGFSIPVGFRGHLQLLLGRPAAGGEDYAAPSDAFAPGEPLSCDLEGESVAALVAFAIAHDELEVAVRPIVDGVFADSQLRIDEVAASPFVGYRVVAASSTGLGQVVVNISVDGRPIGAAPTVASCGS